MVAYASNKTLRQDLWKFSTLCCQPDNQKYGDVVIVYFQ